MEKVEDVYNQWEIARNKVPFFGEKVPAEKLNAGWEERSKDFQGFKGTIYDEVIADLEEFDVIRKDRTLLDIGSGPGAYSIPMSKHLAHIDCTDVSKGMLTRVQDRCKSENIENIDTILGDWRTVNFGKKYDIAFTSLCPVMYCPESLMKMEELSTDYCVHLSCGDVGSKISLKIWKELGKDYSFDGFKTEYPIRYLEALDRNPFSKFYMVHSEFETKYDKALETELKYFHDSGYTGNDVDEIITSGVSEYKIDDMVRLEKDMRIGMVVWKVN